MNQFKGRWLIVDDDHMVRELLSNALEKHGYGAISCHSVVQMKNLLTQQRFDGIFLNIFLESAYTLENIPFISNNSPHTKIFMLASPDRLSKAKEALKIGALCDFQIDQDPDEIVKKAESFLESNASNANPIIQNDLLVGNSPAIQHTLQQIERIKDIDSNVLILGESGTGKEIVARLIHKESKRKNARFEAINCGAIPENLLESEIFGHVRGAFTDARTDRKGIFEICSEGTLLLDEIGDMPLNLQTKLLRVLQERKITPVGSNKQISINTRVIAATHRNLVEEVSNKRFREDLFYRLSVVVMTLPSLRERKSDIAILTQHFINKFNKRFQKNIRFPDSSLISRLESYSWPGNVRELQNCIERGAVFAKNDRLEFEDMLTHLQIPKNKERINDTTSAFLEDIYKMPLTEAKQVFEKNYLENLLKTHKGNIAELSRRTKRYRADLYRMFERYMINIDDYRN